MSGVIVHCFPTRLGSVSAAGNVSYSFYVELGETPRYEDVFGASSVELETGDGYADELVGRWEAGHVLPVWRPGISTRPIELAFEGGRFSMRLLACSCPEDYRLGLDLVCAVAERAGVEVESEEGVRFAPEERDAHYGDDWIQQHVDSMVSAVLAQVRGFEGQMTLPGTTCDFHIGPRFAATLDDGDALFAAMRARFYPNEEEVYVANALCITLDDGSSFTTTALAPGAAYVFPQVDYLTVFGQEPFAIPFDALEEILGADAITWVDEVTSRIDAIEGDAWEAFEKEALAHAVDPSGRASLSASAPPAEAQSPLWGLIVGVLLVVAVALWFLIR